MNGPITEWFDQGAHCLVCDQPYAECEGYTAEGRAVVACADCGAVYVVDPQTASHMADDDLPVIEFDYGTEVERDVNVLDDAPYGDGYSW
jgi:hypothetical protein